MKKKLFYRSTVLLSMLLFAGIPVAQAGTIYLYVDNKTNDRIIVGSKTVDPHNTKEVSSIEGTPNDHWGQAPGASRTVVTMKLMHLNKPIFLKAISVSRKEEFPVRTVRQGFSWDMSLEDNTPIEWAYSDEDVPGGERVLTVKQDKNCSSCKYYKITARKKTYLVRAPDIYFTVEEVMSS